MKKYLLLLLISGIIGVVITSTLITSGFTYTYEGGSGIYNTPHDLRPGTVAGNLYGSDDYLERLCIWCHAPHHTLHPGEVSIQNAYVPLWNRLITEQAYTPYSNGGDSGNLSLEIGPVSRLCLSCHDGTIAVNTYGFDPQDIRSRKTGGTFISNQYTIGGNGDLSNHHPIGFNYREVAEINDEIADPDNTVMVESTQGQGKAGKTLYIKDVLVDDKMECTTCHEIHNSQNPGAEKLLWKSDRNSALCTTCHLKGQP